MPDSMLTESAAKQSVALPLGGRLAAARAPLRSMADAGVGRHRAGPRPSTSTPTVIHPARAAIATRNVCAMHVLERIATRFNQADIPILLLKGAALNLTLYERPDERPMTDIDLLVRNEHVAQARGLLEQMGCRAGAPLVRADFFPRYYYETQYFAGEVFPIKIDLHVRPFRPLRFARLLPPDALWDDARPIRLGRATVWVPGAEDMLIHLAAHAAIHGSTRDTWLTDIHRWVAARTAQTNRTRSVSDGLIDWNRFLDKVERWHLALPVREALACAAWERDIAVPPRVAERLQQMPVNWRDRLTLRQAPRDLNHPIAHVLVDVLCTPGWTVKCGYLLALLLPDRAHMEQWYPRRHRLWLPCAHVIRWLYPLLRRARVWRDAMNK